MSPLQYEILRTELNKSRDAALEQRDRAQQDKERNNEEEKARKASAEQRARDQARETFQVEKFKRFEWQKAAYESRRREEAERLELQRKSDRYLKANHPEEYDRQLQDRERNQARVRQEKALKSRGEQRAAARESSDQSRERDDASQAGPANIWARALTASGRQALEEARSRDQQQERERDRGR